MSVKGLEELLEVRLRIMRAGRSLGVVLDRENGILPVAYPFHRAVIEVEVSDLKPLGTRHAAGIAPHRETVVL